MAVGANHTERGTEMPENSIAPKYAENTYAKNPPLRLHRSSNPIMFWIATNAAVIALVMLAVALVIV